MIDFFKRFRSIWWVLLTYFLFSIINAFTVQLFVIPKIFSDHHHTNGLLINTDSTEFHKFACDFAGSMKRNGLSSWKLNPVDNAHLQPATITSLFYYFFVSEPWVILPLNALLHALGGFILFYISFKITNRTWIGIASSLAFVLFPSTLTWYAQIHRDGFFIVGCYCLALSTLWAGENLTSKTLPKIITSSLAGAFCIYLSREYAVFIIIGACVISILLHRIYILIKNKKYLLPAISISVGTITFLIIIIYGRIEHGNWENLPGSEWKYSKWIPNEMEHQLLGIAKRREFFFLEHPDANTHLDKDRSFNSAMDVLSYIPKSLVNTYFYPFPISGEKSGSGVAMKVASLEMTIIYLIYAVLLIIIICRQRIRLHCGLFTYAVLSIIPFALAISNLGTLYRIRYFSVMLMLCLLITSILQVIGNRTSTKKKEAL
tara:strand:+ start:7027 stop:8322 length:1296 start_codon:yes stop_codon:yes gene_type:complete